LLARLISALCRPRGSSGMIRVMVSSGIFYFGDGSWLSPALRVHTRQLPESAGAHWVA
jgi:hypothetical protein